MTVAIVAIMVLVDLCCRQVGIVVVVINPSGGGNDCNHCKDRKLRSLKYCNRNYGSCNGSRSNSGRNRRLIEVVEVVGEVGTRKCSRGCRRCS